ncbi:hypothetical protein D3C71_1960710 [compost metagenome]
MLSGEIILTFKEAAEGKVKIVRPSDKRMDKVVLIKTDAEYKSVIPSDEIAKGRWKLIMTWNSAGKSYLDEQEVMIK